MEMINITQGDMEKAFALSMEIPEFQEPYPWEKWQRRLAVEDVVILVAHVDDQPAGFKVGYGTPEFFYSWIGGVLPDFRKHGVARILADKMEELIKPRYAALRMKTRNRYKAMLHFALSNGFNIVEVLPATSGHPVHDIRIVLEKKFSFGDYVEKRV